MNSPFQHTLFSSKPLRVVSLMIIHKVGSAGHQNKNFLHGSFSPDSTLSQNRAKPENSTKIYTPDRDATGNVILIHVLMFLLLLAGKTTSHWARIARLTAPCPSHKKLQRKNFNILLTPTSPPTPMPTPGVVQ